MKQYVVDAFTDRVFHGNPAAVCLLESWLSEEQMLCIARENNLSETAFTVREGDRYHLRWFTPGGEIDLCGHATLATAFVLLQSASSETETLFFDTRSGELTVTKRDTLYELDFPVYSLTPVPITPQISEAIGAVPAEVYLGRDLLCVFPEEATVRALRPNWEKLTALDGLLCHATSPGTQTDCVSRSFAPKLSVPEDPVCGSGHCHIIPFWARRLRQNSLVAEQASPRGGTLYCRLEGDRVKLAGKAVLYSVADLFLPPQA